MFKFDLLNENFKFETISVIQYIADVLIIMIIMCMLVYLSFSIVKKSQINDNFQKNEEERNKIQDKIDIKNQIEIIQNGIVMIDSESYIVPARRNLSNHINDDDSPKVKHLNSLNYEEYDVFNLNKTNINSINNQGD